VPGGPRETEQADAAAAADGRLTPEDD
jgi:hypothetical protein